MEELTYFEALNYVQSQMPISKDGVQMTEEKINDLFLFRFFISKFMQKIFYV